MYTTLTCRDPKGSTVPRITAFDTDRLDGFKYDQGVYRDTLPTHGQLSQFRTRPSGSLLLLLPLLLLLLLLLLKAARTSTSHRESSCYYCSKLHRLRCDTTNDTLVLHCPCGFILTRLAGATTSYPTSTNHDSMRATKTARGGGQRNGVKAAPR